MILQEIWIKDQCDTVITRKHVTEHVRITVTLHYKTMVSATAAINIRQRVDMSKSLTLNAEVQLQKVATGEILFTEHVLPCKVVYNMHII